MLEKLEESESLSPICPECGKSTMVHIQYGYPARELIEAAHRKEVIIGGCISGPGKPSRGCTSCGWREHRSFDADLRRLFGPLLDEKLDESE